MKDQRRPEDQTKSVSLFEEIHKAAKKLEHEAKRIDRPFDSEDPLIATIHTSQLTHILENMEHAIQQLKHIRYASEYGECGDDTGPLELLRKIHELSATY